VKEKIEKFETMEDVNETCKNAPAPSCSIFVTEPEDDKIVQDKNANRLSIASTSSVESSRSDNDDEAVCAGSSVFYVVWD
jgi:hypothetical protein